MKNVQRTMFARVSDNVLEKADWPVVQLAVLDGVVVAVETLHEGVHSIDSMPRVGWTTDMMVDWINHDSTGSHPETYHEFSDQPDFVTTFFERGLRRFLAGELRPVADEQMPAQRGEPPPNTCANIISEMEPSL